MEASTQQQDERQTKPKARSGKKSKHIIRKIIIILIILAILAGAAWYLISSLKSKYTVTYQPYTASIGTISNSLSFNGTLQAVNSASYTANSNATVRAVYTGTGAQVHEGDKLIRLSTGQVIEAEFDGEVDVLYCAEGDSVSAGETLCQVVDFTHMKTNIRVDEYDINSVQPGDAIRVTTTANEKQFDATIATISHVSSSSGAVAYYTATAYVDVDSGVYPGMQVTVTLPQEEAANVVILKMNAISFDEDNSAFVYTMDEKGDMQKTPITTGVSNGNYTEITSGLKDGDTVYTEVKTETASTVNSLLGGLFGQTQMMGGMPDMSSMPGGGSFGGGSMPDFSSFGGFGGS
ncbi:MAG: HlyD family efflux transporter periplasmic adaptor subunit, partial [Clostridia bacterium]|nr:HlyD family efflux transporter periplasmic adaptor subunit [Clostridia bacterium]